MAQVIESGREVSVNCYQRGCAGIKITVTLGKEFNVRLGFIAQGGVGRFSWGSGNVKAKGFELERGDSGSCNCSRCDTSFASVVAISDTNGLTQTIFGYDQVPA